MGQHYDTAGPRRRGSTLGRMIAHALCTFLAIFSFGCRGPIPTSRRAPGPKPTIRELAGVWSFDKATCDHLAKHRGYTTGADRLVLRKDMRFTLVGMPDCWIAHTPVPGRLQYGAGRWQAIEYGDEWVVELRFEELGGGTVSLTTWLIRVGDMAGRTRLFTYVGDPDSGEILVWQRVGDANEPVRVEPAVSKRLQTQTGPSFRPGNGSEPSGYLASLGSHDPDIRAGAVAALAARDDPNLCWPLIQAAARSSDERLLRSIVRVVLRIGPTRLDSDTIGKVEDRLMHPLPPTPITANGVTLRDCAAVIMNTDFGFSIGWRGPPNKEAGTERYANELTGVPVFRALCVLLLRMSPRVPMGIAYTGRIRIDSIARLKDAHRWARRVEKVAETRRSRAMASEEGRRTLDRLDRIIARREVFPADVDGTRTVAFVESLRKVLGVPVTAEWAAIAKSGCGQASFVESPARMDKISLSAVFPCELREEGKECHIDFLIDRDGSVTVTTFEEVETRLGGRGEPP